MSLAGVWNRGEVFAAGRHIATYADSTTYFTHSDWLGTERARTTVTGTVYETCTSLPFGDWLTCSGGDPSPLHFTGKERDSESGLDNFGARYNSSSLGRYLTPDWSDGPEPVPYANFTNPQTLNLYAIANDNPETFADLDGHSVCMFSASTSGPSCDSEVNATFESKPTTGSSQQQPHKKKGKRKPKRKQKPKKRRLVKAEPQKLHRGTAAAQRDVYYYAVTLENGTPVVSRNHVLTLSERWDGTPGPATICDPACVQKDPEYVQKGAMVDGQTALLGQSSLLIRRWSVDGEPAGVLNDQNVVFDYEILRISFEADPSFQVEYKNDPKP